MAIFNRKKQVLSPSIDVKKDQKFDLISKSSIEDLFAKNNKTQTLSKTIDKKEFEQSSPKKVGATEMFKPQIDAKLGSASDIKLKDLIKEQSHFASEDNSKLNLGVEYSEPLTPIESYDIYDIARRKIVENYERVDKQNSALQFMDLAVQIHLYLMGDLEVTPEEIEPIITKFFGNSLDYLHSGKAIIFSDNIIFDVINYHEAGLPIVLSSSKLILQANLGSWQEVLGKANERVERIIRSFIIILENALDAGFEIQTPQGIVLIRVIKNNVRITTLFASSQFLEEFATIETARRAYLTEQDLANSSEEKAKQELINREALIKVHNVLEVETPDIKIIDLKSIKSLHKTKVNPQIKKEHIESKTKLIDKPTTKTTSKTVAKISKSPPKAIIKNKAKNGK